MQIRVSDNTPGNFKVKSRQDAVGGEFIVGESGTITVSAGAEDTLVAISVTDTTMRVGNLINLQVRLEDQYGNGLDGSTIRFNRTQGKN